MAPQSVSYFRPGKTAGKRIAYSLAAGAAAGAASHADAFVVYSGIENRSITQGFSQNLQLDGDEYNDIQLKNFVNPYNDGSSGNFQGAFIPFSPGGMVSKNYNGLNYATALGAGVFVDQSTISAFVASMAFGANHTHDEFNLINNAYLGFGFPVSGDGSAENHFGWIRVSINNAAGTFVINDWAYETVPGLGITTGDKGDAGDFNDDGRVDGADYVMWRKKLGTADTLNGHGDENGGSVNLVDNDDYTLWRANFGHVQPATPGLGAATVPEPITLGLLASGSLGVLGLRRVRRGNS